MSTRLVTWLSALALIALVFAAPDADARRRRRSSNGPLKTAVVPFEGDKSGGVPIAESVELELELVEFVVVKTAKTMKRDLRRAGKKGFAPRTLSKIMRRRGLDIVIRGVRDKASRGRRDKLHVWAYASDGKPRVHFEMSLPGRRVDDAAVDIVKELAPHLGDWKRLKPIGEEQEKPRRKPRVAATPEPADDLGEDDLFVDFDEPGDEPKKPKKTRRRIDEEPDVDDVLAADDEPPPRKPPRRTSRRVLSDDADDEDTERAGSRRALLTDEDEDEDSLDERRARRRRSVLGDDDDDRPRKPSRRLADDDPNPSDIPLSSVVTLETFGGGAIWLHDFKGKIADQSFSPGVLRKLGAGAAASAWFVPNVGATVDLRWMLLPDVSLGNAGLSPPSVSTNELGAGLMLKARYLHEASPTAFAIGARAGYRFNVGTVEPQLDDRENLLTIIPGWSFHAFALGAEAYMGFIAADRRFEVELHADFLAPQYAESPDNPGASVTAFGWDVGLNVRIPIVQPVFANLYGFSGGVFANFDGTGDRFGLAQNEDGSRSPVAGGTVLNTTSGGGLGIGVFF
jgi:hypothetical protein